MLLHTLLSSLFGATATSHYITFFNVGKEYKNITVGVPREILENERRVALSPAGVKILSKIGYGVKVEAAAGAAAKFSDSMYSDSGAVVTDKTDALSSDIVLKVRMDFGCYIYFLMFVSKNNLRFE